MQNSVLFRRSSFFVDAMNVIFYSDLFIYHELSKRMESNEFLTSIFGDKMPNFTASTRGDLDKLIIKSTVTKKNQNILLDWISKEKYNQSDINITMDEYVALLYQDIFTSPVCDEYLQLTEFGNTLKLLSKDRQVNKISVYIPFKSDFLINSIYDFISHGYSRSNYNIIIGQKDFLKKEKYDSYIFENVLDVDDYLAIPENEVVPGAKFIKEVVIPTYEYNMEDGRTNLDILVEQVTYHKLKLKNNPNEYSSKYNLSINTISVPI